MTRDFLSVVLAGKWPLHLRCEEPYVSQVIGRDKSFLPTPESVFSFLTYNKVSAFLETVINDRVEYPLRLLQLILCPYFLSPISWGDRFW